MLHKFSVAQIVAELIKYSVSYGIVAVLRTFSTLHNDLMSRPNSGCISLPPLPLFCLSSTASYRYPSPKPSFRPLHRPPSLPPAVSIALGAVPRSAAHVRQPDHQRERERRRASRHE